MLEMIHKLRCQRGAGVVEMILIIVVLVGLILVFKEQLTDLVTTIFDTIFEEASEV